MIAEQPPGKRPPTAEVLEHHPRKGEQPAVLVVACPFCGARQLYAEPPVPALVRASCCNRKRRYRIRRPT